MAALPDRPGPPRRAAGRLGSERLAALEADLRTMVPQGRFRLDVPGWFGT